MLTAQDLRYLQVPMILLHTRPHQCTFTNAREGSSKPYRTYDHTEKILLDLPLRV